jgi:sulfhydrogenase subunit delta
MKKGVMNIMVSKKENKKLKIGLHGVSGCAGCLLTFIYEDVFKDLTELVDVVSFPLIKDESYKGRFDYVFIEGTVCFDEDIVVLNELRKRADNVVALGACACLGGVPSMKNFLDKEKVMKFVYPKYNHLKAEDPTPIDRHIKVDYYIPQCPPDKKELLEFVKKIATGQKFHNYINPVCLECRNKRNTCLLEQGELCLGPITAGGCDALCPTNKVACYGCRGPCKQSSIQAFINLMKEKGYNEEQVHDKMRTFAGLQFKDEEEEQKSTWLED